MLSYPQRDVTGHGLQEQLLQPMGDSASCVDVQSSEQPICINSLDDTSASAAPESLASRIGAPCSSLLDCWRAMDWRSRLNVLRVLLVLLPALVSGWMLLGDIISTDQQFSSLLSNYCSASSAFVSLDPTEQVCRPRSVLNIDQVQGTCPCMASDHTDGSQPCTVWCPPNMSDASECMCAPSSYVAVDSATQRAVANLSCQTTALMGACTGSVSAGVSTVWPYATNPQLSIGFLIFAALATCWMFGLHLLELNFLWRTGFQLEEAKQLRSDAYRTHMRAAVFALSCCGRYSADFGYELLVTFFLGLPALVVSIITEAGVESAGAAQWQLCARLQDPGAWLPCVGIISLGTVHLQSQSHTAWLLSGLHSGLPFIMLLLVCLDLTYTLAYSALWGAAHDAYVRGDGRSPVWALWLSSVALAIVGVIIVILGQASSAPALQFVGICIGMWYLPMTAWMIIGWIYNKASDSCRN
jgi:hypothetical protein